MHEQQKKAFKKKLGKNLEKAKISLRNVFAGEFVCETDAQNEAKSGLTNI